MPNATGGLFYLQLFIPEDTPKGKKNSNDEEGP